MAVGVTLQAADYRAAKADLWGQDARGAIADDWKRQVLDAAQNPQPAAGGGGAEAASNQQASPIVPAAPQPQDTPDPAQTYRNQAAENWAAQATALLPKDNAAPPSPDLTTGVAAPSQQPASPPAEQPIPPSPSAAPPAVSDFPANPVLTPPKAVQGNWQDLANAQLGKPYIWGSAGGRSDFSPNAAGFDCSGFVSYVYKNALGINLPAQTASAYQATRAISPDQAQPGDIVEFNMDSADPHQQHIAIYMGNGQVIQAGGTRSDVNIGRVDQFGPGSFQFRRAVGAETPRDNTAARFEVGATANAASGGGGAALPAAGGVMPDAGNAPPSNPVQGVGDALGGAAQGVGQKVQGLTDWLTSLARDPTDSELSQFLAQAQAGQQAQTRGTVQAAESIGQGPVEARGTPFDAITGAAKSGLDALGQSGLGQFKAEHFPSVLDPNHPANVATDLEQKYGTWMPSDKMTPEDQARAENVMLAIGGLTGPVGAAYDEFGVLKGFTPPAAKPEAFPETFRPTTGDAAMLEPEIAATLPQPPTEQELMQRFVDQAKAAGVDTSAVEAQMRPSPTGLPPTIPPASINPFQLETAPGPNRTVLTPEQALAHLEDLDARHAANDSRINQLEAQLHGGDLGGSTGVVRPPGTVGWTDAEVEAYAHIHGLSPYSTQGWGAMAGDAQYIAAHKPSVPSVPKQTPTQARAELTRLRAENEQIAAAADHAWEHGDATFYRNEGSTTTDLPWDYNAPSDTAPAANPPANAAGALTRGGLADPGTAPQGIGTAPPARAPVPPAQSELNAPAYEAPDLWNQPDAVPPNGAPPVPPVPPTSPVGPGAVPPIAKPVTGGELLNAYHSGGVVSGIGTLAHVAANSIIAPVWSAAARTGADLTGLRFDRIAGRSIGASTALVNLGNDFMEGLRGALNNPHSVANRVDNTALHYFLQAQTAVGGGLHGAFQSLAQGAATRLELGALAGEQAAREGLTGSAFANRVGELVNDPTQLAGNAAARARDVGTRASLRGEAGSIQQAMQAIAKVPVLGNTLFPVVRIAAQSVAQGVERSPLGLVGTGIDVARGLAKSGPYAKGFGELGGAVTPLGDRLTNNLAGTAVTAWFAQKALDGSVTGNGPADPNERALLVSQGWQPHSVYIPGFGYRDIHFFGQLAQPLAQAGALGDALLYSPKGEASTAEDRIGTALNSYSAYMDNTTGLQTLGELSSLFKGGAGAEKMAASFLGNTAGGFVPESGMVRSAALATDAGPARKAELGAEPGQGAFSQVVHGIGQTIEQNIPGLRNNVPTTQDVLGRNENNMSAGLNVLLPRGGGGTPSDVLAAFTAAGATIPPPVKAISLGNTQMPLSLDEQRQYQQIRGQLLEQQANKIIADPAFANRPQPEQRYILEHLLAAVDQAARGHMLQSMQGQVGQRVAAGRETAIQKHAPMAPVLTTSVPLGR